MPEFPPEEFDSLTPILTPTTYRVPVSPAKKTVKNRLDATHRTLTGREKADLTSAKSVLSKKWYKLNDDIRTALITVPGQSRSSDWSSASKSPHPNISQRLLWPQQTPSHRDQA